MVRQAACACDGLRITLKGDPEKVSSCCCIQCQRRTGSFFGVTAFFTDEQVVTIQGTSNVFRRIGESGHPLEFHFCPACGSTIYWYPRARAGRIAIAAGAFGDAEFPPPERMIWTEHRHPWVMTPENLPLFERSP